MDICTLVIPMTVNAIGCLTTGNVCHFDLTPHVQRMYCTPSPAICHDSGPFYQCVREDKSTYTLSWTADNGPIEVDGSNHAGGTPSPGSD